MSKKVYDVTVSNGQYQNQQGETKTRWLNVGAIVENDKGNLSLILNALPAPTQGKERMAYFMNVFPVKQREEQPPQQTGGGLRDDPDPDDSIPF